MAVLERVSSPETKSDDVVVHCVKGFCTYGLIARDDDRVASRQMRSAILSRSEAISEATDIPDAGTVWVVDEDEWSRITRR
jgi:hypothetical protein